MKIAAVQTIPVTPRGHGALGYLVVVRAEDGLAGGRVRDRVRLYTHTRFGDESPQEFADSARQAVALGFGAVKFDPLGGAVQQLSGPDLRCAVERVRATREAVGPDVEVQIEGHGRLSADAAIRFGLAAADRDPFFFEEPCPPENPAEIARVSATWPTRERALEEEVDLGRALADEVWGKYGRRKAFRGWYLTFELGRLERRRVECLRRLGTHCKGLSPHLPNLISPYIHGGKLVDDPISLEQHHADWDEILGALEGAVDINAFQDGRVGFLNLMPRAS